MYYISREPFPPDFTACETQVYSGSMASRQQNSLSVRSRWRPISTSDMHYIVSPFVRVRLFTIPRTGLKQHCGGAPSIPVFSYVVITLALTPLMDHDIPRVITLVREVLMHTGHCLAAMDQTSTWVRRQDTAGHSAHFWTVIIESSSLGNGGPGSADGSFSDTVISKPCINYVCIVAQSSVLAPRELQYLCFEQRHQSRPKALAKFAQRWFCSTPNRTTCISCSEATRRGVW